MRSKSLTIQVSTVTKNVCPAGSRSHELIQNLADVSTYYYQPGELFLNLPAEGGTMRFTPVITGN